MGEWGVKDAAQRLAKLLNTDGHKCEVVAPSKRSSDGEAQESPSRLRRMHNEFGCKAS
jgi:hypothetical protein